jgi:hypothetical protein
MFQRIGFFKTVQAGATQTAMEKKEETKQNA